MWRMLQRCDVMSVESETDDELRCVFPEKRLRIGRRIEGGTLARFTVERKALPKRPVIVRMPTITLLPGERETLLLATREDYWARVETDFIRVQGKLSRLGCFVPLERHLYGDGTERLIGVVPVDTLRVKPKVRVLSDEQRARLSEQLRRGREAQAQAAS